MLNFHRRHSPCDSYPSAWPSVSIKRLNTTVVGYSPAPPASKGTAQGKDQVADPVEDSVSESVGSTVWGLGEMRRSVMAPTTSTAQSTTNQSPFRT